ncbi:putative GPI-anchored cupredoxin [Beauveria bassiana]|nr:putative GPI-anchored cupredoxin [Beauveria bassiana]
MKITSLLQASVAAIGLLAPSADARAHRRAHYGITIRRNVVANETTGNTLIPVVVGGPQDLFVPNLVRAAVGDVVQFQFSNGNHTVTQSEESEGCTPLQAKDPSAVHSGHIPFQDGQVEVGTFSMVVQSTEPMFLYCATGPHCQTGQVMVINP